MTDGVREGIKAFFVPGSLFGVHFADNLEYIQRLQNFPFILALKACKCILKLATINLRSNGKENVLHKKRMSYI